MDREHCPLILGPEELARLQELTTLREPWVDPAALDSGQNSFGDVELIVGSWGMPALSSGLLARLPGLKVLFYAAGTIKHIATPASWDRGVRITHAALENAKPTAEFTFAEIILSLKRAWERMFLLREKRLYRQQDDLTPGCYGSTVGLLSLGKVGRLVARRLATLDVKVIAYDPTLPSEEARLLGVRLCSLPEVFATADVVSCHMPSIAHTDGRLDRALFASMKSGATFINTARGRLVDEAGLVEVLRTRPDIYAVLDVTFQEPLPPDSPLWQLPNVVLTPHIAGSIGAECRRMGRMMVSDVACYLGGQPMRGEVLQIQLDQLA